VNLYLKRLRLDFKKNRLESKTLAIRLRALTELTKLRSNIATSYSELDYFFVAEKFDCSIRTLQRWKAEYAIKGCEGLRSKKRGNNPKIFIKGGHDPCGDGLSRRAAKTSCFGFLPSSRNLVICKQASLK
jgi:hypothetical protein